MRRIFSIIICLAAVVGAMAQDDKWFPYPTAPESLPLGRPRANFIVEHFWDRCPWKQAYSSTARMEGALRDFATFLPHASADTVHISIDHLIKESSKRPENLAALIKMAEATFHSDSATLFSDEVYMPFVAAGAGAKKLSPELRNRCAAELQVLQTSSEGQTLPAIAARRKDGSTFELNDTSSHAITYIIILEKPGDSMARFERVRFASNVAASELIGAGIVKPVLLCAGTATDDWWGTTATLSPQWSVGELADADKYFDLRFNPAVYVLDSDMRIERKLMPLSLLTANCEQILSNINRSAQ